MVRVTLLTIAALLSTVSVYSAPAERPSKPVHPPASDDPPKNPLPKTETPFDRFLHSIPIEKPRSKAEAAPFELAAAVPLLLLYLEQIEVRNELGLSPTQVEQIWKLRSLTNIAPPRTATRAAFGAAASLCRTVPPERVPAALATILTRAQQERLQQIIYQHRMKEFGAAAVIGQLVDQMKPSMDQRQEFESLRADRTVAILNAVTSGKRYEGISEEVAGSNRHYFGQVRDLLTPKQAERIRDLVGSPFDGEIRLRSATIMNAHRTHESPFNQLFGKYYFEIDFLEQDAVRAELQLSHAQKQQADEVFNKVNAIIRAARMQDSRANLGKMASSCHRYIEQSLKDILFPVQRERLDEIAIQYRAHLGGWEAVCGHPTAAARLKLTEVQLEQLGKGVLVDEALTPEQFGQLRSLLGKPFRAEVVFMKELVPALGAWSTASVAYPFYILQHGEKLKLTGEQIKRLYDLAEEEPKVRALIHRELGYSAGPVVVGGGRPLPPEVQVLERYLKSIERQTHMLLTERQRSTLGVKLDAK